MRARPTDDRPRCVPVGEWAGSGPAPLDRFALARMIEAIADLPPAVAATSRVYMDGNCLVPIGEVI